MQPRIKSKKQILTSLYKYWGPIFELVQILGLFDSAVIFVIKFSFMFRLALATLWHFIFGDFQWNFVMEADGN